MLSGFVKCVGTFENVLFTDTFDRGLSTAIIVADDFSLSASSILIRHCLIGEKSGCARLKCNHANVSDRFRASFGFT